MYKANKVIFIRFLISLASQLHDCCIFRHQANNNTPPKNHSMIDFRNYLRVVYSNRTCDRVYILLINMKNIPYDLVCASSYTPKKESLIRYPFCFASQALMSLLWLHAFPLPSSLALAFSIGIVYISQHLFNTPLVLAQQTIVQFFSCVHLFFC